MCQYQFLDIPKRNVHAVIIAAININTIIMLLSLRLSDCLSNEQKNSKLLMTHV